MKSSAELEKVIRSKKEAVLLINVHSRKGRKMFGEARDLLEQAGFKVVATYRLKKTKKLNETIEEALSLNPTLLVVGSGDGTVSVVADHLAYRDTALAFLPMGTTNNFARSVGLPLNLEGAVDVITGGKVASIDLGKINDSYFANVASIGLTVDIAANIPHWLKRHFGRLAYTITGVKTLSKHKAFQVHVEVDGKKEFQFDTHQLIAANGRFHAGSLIARDAHIDSDELVVFKLGDTRRWQLARSVVLMAYGRPRTLQEQNYMTGQQFSIVTNPSRDIEMDGEVRARTPAEFSVAPEALKILVPQEFEDV